MNSVIIVAFTTINLPELWENYKINMSFDILQKERHRSVDYNLTVTPYILNKVLILIGN